MSTSKIYRKAKINLSYAAWAETGDLSIQVGEWTENNITDSFGQEKLVNTYLLIVPAEKTGALENVIIDALKELFLPFKSLGEEKECNIKA